jgi:hypothetical protein
MYIYLYMYNVCVSYIAACKCIAVFPSPGFCEFKTPPKGESRSSDSDYVSWYTISTQVPTPSPTPVPTPVSNSNTL